MQLEQPPPIIKPLEISDKTTKLQRVKNFFAGSYIGLDDNFYISTIYININIDIGKKERR